MPDTPTPAPALTDEQIEELTETARADFVASAADEDEIRADHETFARWLAAVIARAKREERERIADDIQARATALLSSLDAMPEERRQGGHMFVLNTIACANIARKEPEATNV